MGWAIDGTGSSTTDPKEALKGTLLPIGGPKGYGMAFFIDLLCGVISGSKFSREISTFHKPLSPTGVGVMTMAIDISRFMPLDAFTPIIEDHIKSIRNSEKGESCSRIYLPGEIEAEKEELAHTRGVEVDSSVLDTVDGLLKEKGLSIKLTDGVVLE